MCTYLFHGALGTENRELEHQVFAKTVMLAYHKELSFHHHCANPVPRPFPRVVSQIFFREGWGGVLPLLGAEGPQKWVPPAEGARFSKIFGIFKMKSI